MPVSEVSAFKKSQTYYKVADKKTTATNFHGFGNRMNTLTPDLIDSASEKLAQAEFQTICRNLFADSGVFLVLMNCSFGTTAVGKLA
eukprot:1513036-Amphidinium_carterae.2